MALPVDAWRLDVVSAGLQKCLAGPPGSAPLTLNERAENRIVRRRHVEAGLKRAGEKEGKGPIIRSNYFDLAMIMDFSSEQALHHHTEAAHILFAAPESGPTLGEEG